MSVLDYPPRPDRGLLSLLVVSVAINAFLLFALAMRTLDLYRAEARQERVFTLRLERVQP